MTICLQFELSISGILLHSDFRMCSKNPVNKVKARLKRNEETTTSTYSPLSTDEDQTDYNYQFGNKSFKNRKRSKRRRKDTRSRTDKEKAIETPRSSAKNTSQNPTQSTVCDTPEDAGDILDLIGTRNSTNQPWTSRQWRDQIDNLPSNTTRNETQNCPHNVRKRGTEIEDASSTKRADNGIPIETSQNSVESTTNAQLAVVDVSHYAEDPLDFLGKRNARNKPGTSRKSSANTTSPKTQTVPHNVTEHETRNQREDSDGDSEFAETVAAENNPDRRKNRQLARRKCDFQFPRASLYRLIREILFDLAPEGFKITTLALDALQESAELYLTIFLADSYG